MKIKQKDSAEVIVATITSFVYALTSTVVAIATTVVSVLKQYLNLR